VGDIVNIIRLLAVGAGLALLQHAAVAQSNPSAPPVNNGHLQPTRGSVLDAERADNINVKRNNTQQLNQIDKESARMKRLMGSICSNCEN
jgi:hypothetical protein